MIEIKNVRLTFPGREPIEVTPHAADDWTRDAFFATGDKDAISTDTGSRRFMVIEHEATLSPQIWSTSFPVGKTEHIEQLRKAITAEGQRQVRKLMLSQTYGRLKETTDPFERGLLRANLNAYYGKFAGNVFYEIEVYRAFGIEPPYAGPLVRDLWTSATYPLGIPERCYEPEYTWVETADPIERYCRADVELTNINKPTRHPRGGF